MTWLNKKKKDVNGTQKCVDFKKQTSIIWYQGLRSLHLSVCCLKSLKFSLWALNSSTRKQLSIGGHTGLVLSPKKALWQI